MFFLKSAQKYVFPAITTIVPRISAQIYHCTPTCRYSAVLYLSVPAFHRTFAAVFNTVATMSATIRLDTSARQLFVNEEPVKLTAIEWELLAYLYAHSNTVCTREELWQAVWGLAPAYDTGTMDVHIHDLRRKLKSQDTLQTIRGVGYIFRNQSPAFDQELYWTRLFTSFMPNRLQDCNLPDFFQQLHNDYQSVWAEDAIHVQWHLTPIVNDIITDPPTLRAIFDAVLPLAQTEAATLTFSTQLTLHEFIIRVDTTQKASPISSNRNPFSTQKAQKSLLAAQRFAALLGMAFRTENECERTVFSLSVPMKK